MTPVNPNNTTWLPRKNLLYVDFKYENGEFTVEKVTDKPENWEKFLERFEEYKSQAQVDVTTIGAEQNGNYKSAQIEEISNYVYITCGVVFVIGIITLIAIINKRKINKTY